ncbi:hypothetical protein UFOVP607_29 [uncultured Caudovirales phage]|uniref:Uncharacterized protein n=1 Tax=uncultured Caudovirales phage TaxID=2100421 RepID=A0A6J5NAW9_9CAUD|nr:hypothetical protein UFOVP607_29 [uncultured Caudovirales phage]
MIADTSREAYHSHSLPTLQRKEQEVLAAFDCPSAKYTREQLSARLGWKESAVCGRANSLVAKRVLEECDGGKTSSGRSAKVLRLARKQLESL